MLRLLHELAPRHPQAFAHLLQALDFHLRPHPRGGAGGASTGELERVVRERFRPHIVLAGGEAGRRAAAEGREPVDGRAAAYVCEASPASAPVTEPAELEALLA